ncbi:MAG: thioredoxin [Candidatus Pacearchaeota archaeon]|jgi:thioredoxin 1
MVNTNTDLEVTEEEFNQIINNSNKLVVANFFEEWCMPCLMMGPIIEDLAEEMKHVTFVKINKEDNEELALKLKISSIPCLVVFKNGKEAHRMIGSYSFDIIKNQIEDCLR